MAAAFDPFAKPEHLYKTSRAKEIDCLDKIFEGQQYDGRPDWWTGKKHNRNGSGGAKVFPIRERKPCIIYKLPRAAVQQVTRFLFGAGRFPTIKFDDPDLKPEDRPDPREEASTEAKQEESKEDLANDWLADLIEQADLRSVVQEIAMRAVSVKTAPVIIELDEGRFRFTLPKTQHCWAEFKDGSPRKRVTRLLWSYSFQKEVADEKTGEPKTETYLFRREYDETNIYFYDDVKLVEGRRVEWPVPRAEAHGLSRCPVLWIRNAPDYSDQLDGESLYQGLEEEFESLDITLSKRHSSMVYLGSPQVVETGVKPGDGPQATASRGGPSAFSDKFNVQFTAEAPARAIGSNEVWSYEGENADVKLIEISGKAFEAATMHVTDIRSRLLETMGVVLTAMTDTVTNTRASTREMSARFLMLAHAPLIALVNEYREPWWRNVRDLLELMISMILDKSAQKELIDIADTDQVTQIFSSFRGESNEFQLPRMRPVWGSFFEPSRSEIGENVTATMAAKSGELISEETAILQTSHDFNVDSVDDELRKIIAERVERETLALEKTIMLQEAGAQIQTQGRVSDLDYGKVLQENGNSTRLKNGKPAGSGRGAKRSGATKGSGKQKGGAQGRTASGSATSGN